MPLEIRNPCAERWDALEPRDEGRYCASCERTIVDLSRLTERQALARVDAAEGRICLALRMDGRTHEPIFRPEPARASGWVGGLVAVAALTSGCAGSANSSGAEIVAEPEETDETVDPGPAMQPIDAAAMASIAPRAVTHAIPSAELDRAEDSATPDAAQRRLTARKQRPVACALPSNPNHTYMTMGF